LDSWVVAKDRLIFVMDRKSCIQIASNDVYDGEIKNIIIHFVEHHIKKMKEYPFILLIYCL
jgi:hypothetical protein